GDVAVTIASGDKNRLLLSDDATAAGVQSITISATAGSSSTPAFYAQALGDSGTVTLTATAAGYETATATVTLVPSGFVLGTPIVPCIISDAPFETTTGSPPTTLWALAAPLDPQTLNFQNGTCQGLRGGRPPVSVGVAISDPTVGRVTPTPVTFGPNESTQATAFEPLAGGMAVMTLVPPLGFIVPS